MSSPVALIFNPLIIIYMVKILHNGWAPAQIYVSGKVLANYREWDNSYKFETNDELFFSYDRITHTLKQ